jgi:signal transduction histidine kinase
LGEICANALSAVGSPLAFKILIDLPGLDVEEVSQGNERSLGRLDLALSDFGLDGTRRQLRVSGFLTVSLDDGQSIAIGILKHLGNYAGYVAAIGDDDVSEGIPLSEAVWLCNSQLALRIHTILSPNSPLSVELLGRRILRALIDRGVKYLTIGPAVGSEPWISLHRVAGKTISREVDRLPQDQVAAINNGEIIGENTMKYLWSDPQVALGIWISIEAGYYLAIGFDDRKLPSPQIIGKIREKIEQAARNDYEYLIKSFEKLRTEFDRLVKSERAAAITETTVTINHEINNPLTAILGNTQLLLMSKEKLPEEIIAKLQTIERSAIKIRETTAKLMAIIEPVTTPYVSGLEMIDIDKSKKREPQ